VLLVNLLAALNFANVFLKIKKSLEKNVKKRKNVTKIKKNVKTFLTSMDLMTQLRASRRDQLQSSA